MSETPAEYLVVTERPGARADALKELARLSALASEDWTTVPRLGGGAVIAGPVHHLAHGSGQGQIASFSVPNLLDDDARDPTVIQAANAEFAVACVKFVRGLLAGQSPAKMAASQ